MPVLPFIPAIVGGVSAIAGGIQAHSNANAQKKALEAQQQQQQQLINEQVTNSRMGRELSDFYSPLGKSNLTSVSNYWNKMFSGNRNAINEALAPQINNYLSSTASAERNLSTFANRGNVGDRMIGLQFTKAANLGGARLAQQNTAASNIKDLGSLFAQLGLSGLGQSTQGLSSASSGLAGQQNITLSLLNQANQQSSNIGSGIATLLNAFNWKAGSLAGVFGGGRSQPNTHGIGDVGYGSDE